MQKKHPTKANYNLENRAIHKINNTKQRGTKKLLLTKKLSLEPLVFEPLK